MGMREREREQEKKTNIPPPEAQITLLCSAVQSVHVLLLSFPIFGVVVYIRMRGRESAVKSREWKEGKSMDYMRRDD